MKIPKLIAQNLDDLFLVGGAVRDLLLDIKPKEYDLITTTPLEKIKFKTFKESKQGETVGVFMKGTKYDISHYELLDEDLKRRDFTINSIAFAVQKDGEIIEKPVDPCNGIEDLKKRVLRSFSPDENMKSDPVRILRGLRFISSYDLDVDEHTLHAMKKYMPLVKDVSKERLFQPIDGFINGKYFEKSSYVAKVIGIEMLGIPTKNFDILAKLDPQCRWPAIFFETDLLDLFAERVFPPKRILRFIVRINDFANQIKAYRYEWTIKIKTEEAQCLTQILNAMGVDASAVKKRMQTKLEITPETLKAQGVKGKEIAQKMIEVWKKELKIGD